MYGIIRTLFFEIGKRLNGKGATQEIEDIFFLYPEQVLELFSGKEALLEIIRKNKIIHSSYRNFDRPNEIWVEQTAVSKKAVNSNKLLNGIACANGMVEGEAFVAKSVADAEEMPEGKIMVTKFTDPAWTVYFSKITGLITETGGMLSLSLIHI